MLHSSRRRCAGLHCQALPELKNTRAWAAVLAQRSRKRPCAFSAAKTSPGRTARCGFAVRAAKVAAGGKGSCEMHTVQVDKASTQVGQKVHVRCARPLPENPDMSKIRGPGMYCMPDGRSLPWFSKWCCAGGSLVDIIEKRRGLEP